MTQAQLDGLAMRAAAYVGEASPEGARTLVHEAERRSGCRIRTAGIDKTVTVRDLEEFRALTASIRTDHDFQRKYPWITIGAGYGLIGGALRGFLGPDARYVAVYLGQDCRGTP